MEDYVHLHVHTHYSILDGQSKVEYLVNKAINNGMKGMAITDHGVMYGIKEFSDYCEKINKDRKNKGLSPFKPIFGCEMYVARRRKEDKVKEMHDNSGYHLIVLAKNYVGYKNLIKLVSRSWVDGYYYRPRTDRTDLKKYHEGLIVSSACLAGEIPRKILNNDIQGAREACLWFKNIFGDDFYLELQRHEVKDPNIVANREVFPLQQKVNKAILKLSEELNIKYICTNDCHFEDKETAEAHDHLLCLSTQEELNSPKRMRYSKQEWFKSREEMNEIFGDLPKAMSNTIEILNKVEFYNINNGPIMPFFPIPKDFGTEEELKQKITTEELYDEFTTDENGENQLSPEEGQAVINRLGGYEKIYRIKLEADYLAKLTFDGAKHIYGDPIPKEVYKALIFELHVMKTMGFPGYFLIVQDFINAARNELNVMVGPGRGSAAGSVVAYCLGITRIDPLKYNLLFERFLNPDRVNLPDIDTDFDDDGRGKVLQWVMDKYGEENCAHIITYSTMATKNSIRDVARVEGLPLNISNALCKAIPDRLPNGLKMNLKNAIKYTPELQEAETSEDSRERNTIRYAKMLEGTIRGTGLHACGFIICRDPISDWVPVSTATDPDFPNQKVPVTQYDGHVIETTGLIKMDFLGLKTLSEIKEACKVIKQTRGITIDIDNIPIDDKLTYQLYQKGQTIGTFQFESAGMQKHLRELKPTVFEDLIAMNALYRPGPMDYIPDFIKRKKDPSLVKYDIPCMEKYLKDTYGITVYQEQVMLLSRQLANFTRGESDALRKAMGKKKKDIVDKMKPKFLKQGQENGYDVKILEKIWTDWEKFASYAFNKSHATCYSWVAYQTAYLKAHYPAEFMAALLTRRFSQITEITKLMEECKALKISILGPDINESRIEFGVNKKGAIRFGLSAIKGMGTGAALSIVTERDKNGPYKNIFDFVERIDISNVNKKSLENLAFSGGFDSLGIQREEFSGTNSKGITFIDSLIRYAQLFQQEKSQLQNSLFGGSNEIEIAHPAIPKVEKWPTIEKLNKERDLVGIYLSAHPLDEYSIILNELCNTHANEIASSENMEKLSEQDKITFGGIITSVTERFSRKSGKPFGIITIEDFDSVGEFALFDTNWTKWSSMLKPNYTLFITAKCQPRFYNNKSFELVITNIEHLYDVKQNKLQRFTISIESSSLDSKVVSDLTSIIERKTGNIQLYIKLHKLKENPVILYSTSRKINIDKELIDFIKNTDNMKYSIN